MISLVSALAFFAWLWRAAVARPAFLFAGVFLIWQFMLKVLSALYLDLFGPIYAYEVLVDVGGDGSSTPLLISTLIIPLFLMYLALRPRRSAKAPVSEKFLTTPGISFADVMIFLFWLFLALLYADMLRLGVVPFFEHMDRLDYQGGVFHYVLTNFIWLVSFILGYIFTRSRIVTGVWDIRCVYIAVAILLYLFLTGNRFGAFLVVGTYFALAAAAFFYARANGWEVAPFRSSALGVKSFVPSRRMMGATVLAFGFFILTAMANNLFFVRNYGDQAGDQLTQRLFVQPIELYWLTFDRLQKGEVISSSEAVDFMFNDPFDPARNTGMQYLMTLYLGDKQAEYQFNEEGQDYAGGYPEILIELGGIGGALAAIVAVAMVNAFLYWLAVDAVAKGYFLTAVMAVYVGFGVTGIYLGGMLNFVLVFSYWLKFAALVFITVLDRVCAYYGRRLTPWILLPRPAAIAPLHS